MKTFASLIAAVAAVAVLAGESPAQTTKPAAPATPAAATPAKAAVVKNITGELVVMDKAAKTMTVKHMVDQKPAQMTMNVDEAMLVSLAQFKAGDKIKISYEEMDGKFVAKTVSKA